jgi:uncharacterized protein (TIGR00369 family)
MQVPENNIDIRKARQEALIKLFDTARIKHTYSMDLRYDDDERAIFDMPYNPSLDNGLGGIHGGVISVLLDNAGWFTAAPFYDTWIATSDLHVRLLEPVEKVDLYSIGRVLRTGKKVTMTEMEVRTKDELLVAVGSANFVVTSVPMPKVAGVN